MNLVSSTSSDGKFQEIFYLNFKHALDDKKKLRQGMMYSKALAEMLK